MNLVISVYYNGAAYHARCEGNRASCTSSPEEAARRALEKFAGPDRTRQATFYRIGTAGTADCTHIATIPDDESVSPCLRSPDPRPVLDAIGDKLNADKGRTARCMPTKRTSPMISPVGRPVEPPDVLPPTTDLRTFLMRLHRLTEDAQNIEWPDPFVVINAIAMVDILRERMLRPNDRQRGVPA